MKGKWKITKTQIFPPLPPNFCGALLIWTLMLKLVLIPWKEIVMRGWTFNFRGKSKFLRNLWFSWFPWNWSGREKKRFSVQQLLKCNVRYYSLIHIWTYYIFNIYVSDLYMLNFANFTNETAPCVHGELRRADFWMIQFQKIKDKCLKASVLFFDNHIINGILRKINQKGKTRTPWTYAYTKLHKTLLQSRTKYLKQNGVIH